MHAALRAGIGVDEFWRRTPREIDRVIDAFISNRIDAQNLAAWQAHTTAALTRVKRMPKLKTLLVKDPKDRKTAAQIKDFLMAFKAAHNARLKNEESHGD